MAITTYPPPKMQQLRRNERRMFAAPDDSAMMKQIQATHAPDGREVDVQPFLQLIEAILHHATPSIDGIINGTHEHTEMLDQKAALESGFDGMLEALAYTVHKISCEISCKCSGGGDAHATTMVLFNTLSSYSWESKVVISLAAFAVNYGEFWLVAQLFATNHLAKSVALLKQLPDLLEHSHSLKPQFDALTKLIKAMLEVTKCIVKFQELPSQYISRDTPAMSSATAHIPAATYWTIRSIVACASQIASLIGLRHEHMASTTEAWELSSLAHKVNSIHDHLREQLTLCRRDIDDKIQLEAYLNLVRLLETLHMDNMKILRALIYNKDDIQPLVNGSNKTAASIEILKRKHVLLLISDLDLSHDEILVLDSLYKESLIRRETQYEVVWLPVVDKSIPWNAARQDKFEELQSEMSFYTMRHPSLIEPAVIKYIKEVWHFSKKAIIVALDPQGRVATHKDHKAHNALHMLWIWGNVAFPFTSEKEDALWKSETWKLELLVDGIDPTILDWITQGRIVCLYGGVDMGWIEKFTATTKEVAGAAGISLELLYVGKSNAKERVRKITEAITERNLSHYWPDLTSIWFFWNRLESMMYSKMQHGKSVEKENDHIMPEVMTMLSFDGSDEGWAIVCRGPSEMARAKGDTMLRSMVDFNEWKEDAKQKGFVPALSDHLKRLHSPQHCNRLILPGIDGAILEKVVCAECGRPMEKYFMYRCCND